jgi:molybdenum cofactor biosynthesis enzyme
LRAEAASKITPHKLEALLELGVALLDVFDMFSHL